MDIVSVLSNLPALRQARLRKRKQSLGVSMVADHETSTESQTMHQLVQLEKPWYKVASRVRLYTLLFPGAIMAYATSGYDGSMMNSLQTVTYWDDYFNQPRGALLGVLSAIMSLGSICSSPLAPLVADRFGRRWGITVGSIIMVVGSIMQCESRNIAMFLISRFILGFGLTFCTTAAPTLVAELCHPKERTTITAICNTCWFIGSIVAAWVTFGTLRIESTWSWRIPSLLQMLPSLFQLATIWFLPESPRWLISHDRAGDALEVLKRYHGENEETELVKLEFCEIQEAIKLEKESHLTSWRSLVSTSGNRYRIFLVLCMGFFSQWSGNGLISYYLSRVMDSIGITNRDTQALVNGLINIWNWLIALSTAFFVDKVGRRPLFLVSTVGMTLVFVGWTIASARFSITRNDSAGIAVLALIFLYELFYCIALSPLPVAYSVEILPYGIRAKGMAVYVLSTKGAVFLNQFVNPIGLENIGWKYYIVYCVWLSVEALTAYGFFVETKSYALEEIAVIFDGEENVAQQIVVIEKDNDVLHKE
ncbi:general substrate transporter [Lipomyces tetrasporus]|uniref:General substrate transporter n=1 Tax=Lipomyces tetrasporus TaxID=54092 RepID=A0AAD7VRV2_9ASCO|nr:general substrate transporter [Lipomyces tetrasporus]KAJ8099578.1 general substrate transporter [Lipomyces tetrasporus]